VGIRQHQLLLYCTLVLMLIAACLVNISSLFFEPLAYWVRILVPVLLTIGIAGTLRRSKLSRTAGWIGILLFALVMLTNVMPGEDYTLGGPGMPPHDVPPHLVSHQLVVCRYFAFLTVIASLGASYALLGKSAFKRSDTTD
jgi:hypothetical protein